MKAGHVLFAPFNELRFGAGLRLVNSDPTIVNCTFSLCVADRGGAIYADSTSNPIIENCTFSNNYASAYITFGGAICNDGGTLVVRDSAFLNNTGDGSGSSALGGAVYSKGGSAVIERCTFTANEALPRIGGGVGLSYGGAVYVDSGSVRITDSSFSSNLSNVGGAVSCSDYNDSACQLVNCFFFGNHAVPTLLSGGVEAGAAVGAIYGGLSSTLDILGCLVYGNTADNYGGVLIGGATGLVSSSIFWANTDGSGNIGRSQIRANEVRYSCVMNMLVGELGEDPPDPAKFPGSIALDPGFVNLSIGDYHLAGTSPCIDAGENPGWPASTLTDYEGMPRFVDDPSVPDTGAGPGPIVDMGPLERN